MESIKNPSAEFFSANGEAVAHNLEETQDISFPELIEGSEYLVSFLHSAGTATQTGMGLVPLSWQEISAWAILSGLEECLSVWELEVIKTLSETYAAQYSKSSDRLCPQPYRQIIEKEEIDRVAIAAKVKSILESFVKKK